MIPRRVRPLALFAVASCASPSPETAERFTGPANHSQALFQVTLPYPGNKYVEVPASSSQTIYYYIKNTGTLPGTTTNILCSVFSGTTATCNYAGSNLTLAVGDSQLVAVNVTAGPSTGLTKLSMIASPGAALNLPNIDVY